MRSVRLWLTLTVIGAASAIPAAAQPASSVAALAEGWTALAAGRPAQAAEAAEHALTIAPRSHEAVGLAVAARVAASEPIRALDTYERWLAATTHEDRFLIEPIAVAVLRELAGNTSPRIRFPALQALALSGDVRARAELEKAARPEGLPLEAERALAAIGNRAARQRLEAGIAGGGPRDKSGAIEALEALGSRESVPVLIGALKDPALPSRMAAAEALGALGATEAIPALREALGDAEGPVRVTAAVALDRLGDQSGAPLLRTLEQSPSGDLRLMLTAARAPGHPAGDWVAAAQGLLGDPDPLVRLHAAELLVSYAAEPGDAPAILDAALADPNPALRSTAAASLAAASRRRGLTDDLRTLRRLLRDPVADLRLAGATALLGPAPALR